MRLLEGLSTPAIGQELSLSPLTVRTHIKRIFKKMGVRSQSQLMAALCQLAFVPPLQLGSITDDTPSSMSADLSPL